MFHAQRPDRAAAQLDSSPTTPHSNDKPDLAMSLHGLSKAYGGRVIVDGFSLDIPRGQVLGLIGRSGAGKSTLLRMASLLEKPDSGEVRFCGEPVSGLGGEELLRKRRRVGVVFQAFNLFSSRTAGGNVAFPLEAARRPKAFVKERVAELLGLVGLADKADRPVSRLSGGERQRVAIARALANEPEILFCDEATSALDPETTRQVLDLLSELKERLGLTVVMATHQMEVLRRACGRVAVLEGGRLVETATVRELFADPRSAAARRLVAEPAGGSEAFHG